MCKLMRFSYLSHIVFFTNGPHPVVLAIPAAPHHSHNGPQSPQQQFESNATTSAGITFWVLLMDFQTITLIMNSTDHELLWLTHWLHQLPHWLWTAMTYPLTSSTCPLIANCHDLPTDFINSPTGHELPWFTHWLHQLPHWLWTAMTYPLTSSASHRGFRYIVIWTKFQANHLQSLHPEFLSHFQSNRKKSNVPRLGAYESMWSMRHSCMSWWFCIGQGSTPNPKPT